MRWNFRDSVIYDFDLSVKKELSPPSGTPSINRGRVEILPVFGKSHQLLLCL